MGVRRNPWRFALFSLCLFFSPGLGTARITRNEEDQETLPSSDVFSAQLDDVPFINPTTPGSANPSPTVNPTTPQAPDTTAPVTPTTPPTPTGTTSSSGQWCVASQTASDTALQVALDYACGYGGADCSAIQPGASCYNPTTLRDHASYAFNDYYQKNPAPTSCVFGGTATLTSNDPSSGNCKYTSPKAQSIPPPPTTIQSPPSPVAQTTPSMTYPGDGSTVYGSEPTESPNSATSASYSLLLLFTASFLVAHYI